MTGVKNGMNKATRNLMGAATVAVIVLVVAVARFSGIAILHGPDADDVLVPMYFDISRSIGEHGLFAGMYDSGLVAGLSYWGSPSFHPLYPLYFNWLGSDSTILDTLDRLKLVFFLHMGIYAVGSYLLGRCLGLRQLLAICVGIVAPFLPAFQSVGVWPPISASLAWLPWILFFQARIYQRGWAPAAAIGLAASVTLLIYAQPAQNLVLAFVGSAIVGVVYSVVVVRQRGVQGAHVHLRPIYASLALAAAVIVVACYPYLSGVMDFHSDSIRWLGDGRDISGKDKLPLSALTAHGLGWKAVFAPFAFAHQYSMVVGNLYMGAPIALACLSYPWLFRTRPLITALLASIAISAIFCFAAFGWLLYLLPIANKVREVNWWSLYVVMLALPVGALCLQRLVSLIRRKQQRQWIWWPEISAATIVLMALVGVLVSGEFYWQIVPVLLGAALLWWSASRGVVVNNALLSLVVIVSAAVPIVVAKTPSLGQSMIVRGERIEQRHSMATVFAALESPENYRVAVSEKLPDFKVLGHQLANLGARGIRGDLNPQRRSKFELLYFPKPAVAQLYGVRYTVVAAGTEGALAIDDRYALLDDSAALPRLFLAESGLAVVPSPAASLQAAEGAQVEHIYATPSAVKRLGVEQTTLGEGKFSARPVSAWHNSPVMLQAMVETSGPALLVLNEDSDGRWYAIVDGDVRPGVAVNGFQTAFALPAAGKHSVIIRRPAGFADYFAGLPVGGHQ